MEFTIKSEPGCSFSCIACLKNEGQMFEEHEIRTEIVLTYKEIVKDLVRPFQVLLLRIFINFYGQFL